MIITGDPKEVAAAYIAACVDIQTQLVNDGKANRNTYPTLANVLVTVKPILLAHGLTVTQEPTSNDFGVGVSTSILHCSGSSIDFAPLTMQPADLKPQTVGSTITYCRRYALMSVLGLVGGGEDDDGEQGTRGAQVKPAARPVAQVDDSLWETPASHAKKPDTLSQSQLARIHILGKEIYNDGWKVEGPRMVSEITNGGTSTKELTPEEATTLIRELELKRKKTNGNGHKVAA